MTLLEMYDCGRDTGVFYLPGDETIVTLPNGSKTTIGAIRVRLIDSSQGLEQDLEEIREAKRITREVLDMEFTV